MSRPSLDDYIDVAERIANFKAVHPDGSLQTLSWETVSVDGIRRGKDDAPDVPVRQTFIVYHAAAYRNAGDTKPGHGIAWEPFPGSTPYTAQSELMNAETAAWGRAIVALGLTANRKIASRQEVRERGEAPAIETAPQNKVNDAVALARELTERRGILEKRELMTDLKQKGATDVSTVGKAFASLPIEKFEQVVLGLHELLRAVPSDIPSNFDAADPVDQGTLDDVADAVAELKAQRDAGAFKGGVGGAESGPPKAAA